VLGNGCDNARTVDRKALESRVLTGLREHDDAGDRRRGHAHLYAGNQSAQPPAPKLIGIHPPQACRSRETIAKIVRVVEQFGWHRALSDRLTELEAKQDSLTAH
jgi:hypothetical protein